MFDHGAATFNNLDHISIGVRNFCWRFILAEGETKYDVLEKRLAKATITAWEMLFDRLRLDAATEGSLLIVGARAALVPSPRSWRDSSSGSK